MRYMAKPYDIFGNFTSFITFSFLITIFLQLVCFYYVLTTFTTVGYGNCQSEIIIPIYRSTDRLFAAGDVSATSSGERVGILKNCAVLQN